MKKRIAIGLIFLSPAFLLISGFTKTTRNVSPASISITAPLNAIVVQDSDTLQSELLKKVRDQDAEPSHSFKVELPNEITK